MDNNVTFSVVAAYLKETVEVELGNFTSYKGDKYPAIFGKGAYKYRDMLQEMGARWEPKTRKWYFDKLEDAMTAIYEIVKYPDPQCETYLERYVYQKLQNSN